MLIEGGLHSAIESEGHDNLQSSKQIIKGWCFHESGEDVIFGVRARIGESIFQANRKQSRVGLRYLYPQFDHAAKAGFTVEVSLKRGDNPTTLEWKDNSGTWHQFESFNIHRTGFLKSVWQSLIDQGASSKEVSKLPYQRWVDRYDTLDDAAVLRIESDIMTWGTKIPKFSVLMPVHNPPGDYLEAAILSIEAQLWPHWEFCIVDDASTQPHVRPILEKAMARDARIKVRWRNESGHICRATNDALDLSSYEFLVLLDHDDVIPRHALYYLAEKLREHPDADIIYSDEDKLNENGEREGPYFKADHDPYLFLQQNCISHLGAYRAEIVKSIGGFRPGYEGSQDWDLALRCLEKSSPERVQHVPHVLYHWRILPGSTAKHTNEKPYAVIAAQRSVKEHLERTGRKDWEVLVSPYAGLEIRRSRPSRLPKVSIIIPTRNHAQLLRATVESLRSKTNYDDYEIIVVDNGSEEGDALSYLNDLKISGCHVIQSPGAFNFSKLINKGAAMASGSVLILLNNDMVVINEDWLKEMVVWAGDPEIGAVGAKLLYPNTSIQHAGVFLGYHGAAGHLCRGLGMSEVVNGSWHDYLRQVSAVTAACLAVSKDKFIQVKGFDEDSFGVAYNDVDFCLKLKASGYSNIYNPRAIMIHQESASRAVMEASPSRRDERSREIAELESRYGRILRNDPHYNLNLTLEEENLGLALPPRIR